jgi:hypothetical protein
MAAKHHYTNIMDRTWLIKLCREKITSKLQLIKIASHGLVAIPLADTSKSIFILVIARDVSELAREPMYRPG